MVVVAMTAAEAQIFSLSNTSSMQMQTSPSGQCCAASSRVQSLMQGAGAVVVELQLLVAACLVDACNTARTNTDMLSSLYFGGLRMQLTRCSLDQGNALQKGCIQQRKCIWIEMLQPVVTTAAYSIELPANFQHLLLGAISRNSTGQHCT
jgi:hypothetical protein